MCIEIRYNTFLHSCAHLFGLQRLESTMAIRVILSAIVACGLQGRREQSQILLKFPVPPKPDRCLYLDGHSTGSHWHHSSCSLTSWESRARQRKERQRTMEKKNRQRYSTTYPFFPCTLNELWAFE